MATVMTVTGPVGADELGRALVHEHVLITYPGAELDPTDTWSREECIRTAVERMHQLQDVGVRTFVDPCPIELGRDPELLREVAERSGINLVCATGFYMEAGGGIPFYWRARTPEEVAEFYLHEIEKGIGDTGVRPGVIKLATGKPPTEIEKRVVAGAALAARESGLPVITHCESSVGGDVQVAILVEHGVDLSRCLIGHQDEHPTTAPMRAVADAGAFFGIDRVGLTLLAPDERRADFVAELVRDGYVDHLCLSQDHLCSLRAPRHPYPSTPESRAFMDTLVPPVSVQSWNRPHTYLITDFLPLLAERGVDAAAVEQVLADNPRRLLAGA